jgi:hypothetical protein
MNERYRKMVKRKRETMARYKSVEEVPRLVLPAMSFDEATYLRKESELPPISKLKATPEGFFRDKDETNN